jgi:hypothetical protein
MRPRPTSTWWEALMDVVELLVIEAAAILVVGFVAGALSESWQIAVGVQAAVVALAIGAYMMGDRRR